jgi:hypothetical protein
MCALGGKYSPDVSGRYIPKTIAYPIAPTARATITDKNPEFLRDSMLSRKIQKKQKRPRSKTIPSARPIRSENDARPPVSVLELKR